jgi:prepilin-type N-terminal cleavage/methylation domain-containing protein
MNTEGAAKSGDESMRRHGFTLVELLVAMALTLFIMVILSEAFSVGLGSFRQLKAVADMQEKLRTVATIMRRDLQANLYTVAGNPGRLLYLHELDMSDLTNYVPPDAGFFRLWQQNTSGGSSCYLSEGDDGDNIPSIRMNKSTDTILHFSIRLSGSRPENFLSVPVLVAGDPATTVGPPDFRTTDTFNSQLAEVAYFLGSTSVGNTGTTKSGANAGVPLFALFRRQLVAPNPNDATGSTSVDATSLNGQGLTPKTRTTYTASVLPNSGQEDATYFEMSAKEEFKNPQPITGNNLWFNSPTDMTIPDLRFGMDFTPNQGGVPSFKIPNSGGGFLETYPTIHDQLPSPNLAWGDDILLTNVVSFTVQVLVTKLRLETGQTVPNQPSADFVDLFHSTIKATGARNSSINGLLGPPVRVFDTWSQATSGTFYDYKGSGGPPWAYQLLDSNTCVPLQIRVGAIQIIVRVWDEKTERTRQITIVQQM